MPFLGPSSSSSLDIYVCNWKPCYLGNQSDRPAVVALVLDHVEDVAELLHLGEPLPGVLGQGQALQLALGMEAEQDGVEDVLVDQDTSLVRVAVHLLGLVLSVLWG